MFQPALSKASRASLGPGLIGLALLAVVGKVAAEAPDRGPNVDTRSYSRERYLVGVGACGSEVQPAARPACAAKRAREQLSLSISASVKVYVEQKTITTSRRHSGGPATSNRSTDVLRIGSEESSADIDGAQPVKQACDAKAATCYAVIALSKAELAQRWQHKRRGLAERQRQLLEPPRDEDPLAALRRLRRARELALRMNALSGWIVAIADPRGAPPDALAEVERAEAAVLATTVCLGSTELAALELFAESRQALSNVGFGAVRLASANDCRAAALGFVFNGNWRAPRPSDTGLEVRDVAGSLSVWRNAVAIGSSTSVAGHGVAQSAERAEREALEQVSKQMARTILNLLGR